jgi:hypothetical protein
MTTWRMGQASSCSPLGRLTLNCIDYALAGVGNVEFVTYTISSAQAGQVNCLAGVYWLFVEAGFQAGRAQADLKVGLHTNSGANVAARERDRRREES